MELAGEKLHEQTGNCQSYSCAAHRLQLCIEEGLCITETMSIEPKKLQQACITR